MKNSKMKSSKSVQFAKGGSHGMAGKQSAGPEKPGSTMGGNGSGGGKFAKGGASGRMTGKKATPAKAC
jgi:hypothetical protein